MNLRYPIKNLTPARLAFTLFPLLLARCLAAVGAATPALPFTPDRWDLKEADVQEYLGQPTLTGTAWLKDAEFENGVIEVDLATDRQRSYPAIIFRQQSESEYEHVYLRPHRAGLYPDAVQYAPVFNGVTGWQLYSGPGFTAGVSLPENQWVHLRIEVGGTQARVFVGEATQPTLVIDDLKHGRSKGALGLQCPRGGSAHFANFTYRRDDSLRFEPPVPADPTPGIIAHWEISPASRSFDLTPDRYLNGKSVTEISWQPVTAEVGGLVDLARLRKPIADATSKVWARTTIHAQRKESRPFCFGYSDDVSLYLNGQILYRGQSGFKQRDPSFLGIVGWNDTVYLPLEEGANELVLAVSEQFGGWGFMIRDMNAIYLDASLQKVWEISDGLSSPESVAYDAARNLLYVSNFGAGFLSKIGLDGTIAELKWASGLKAPTGLKLFAGKLYVVDRSEVVVIDPERGAVVDRIPIPGADFPNDLAIAADGTIYVTDSFKNCIFKLSGGKAEVWIEGKAVENPNGILVEKDRLLVGVTSDGTIKSIDLTTKQVSPFLTLGPGANMDGLVSDGRDGYLFSDYYGRIYRADAASQRTLLLDRKGPHQFTADFEYLPEAGLLLVPSLFDNRFTAYRRGIEGGSGIMLPSQPPK